MDSTSEPAKIGAGKPSVWDSKGIRLLLFLGTGIVLSVVSVVLLFFVGGSWLAAGEGAPYGFLGLEREPGVTCALGLVVNVGILIAGILAKSRRRFVVLYIVFSLVQVLYSMAVLAAFWDYRFIDDSGWMP